MQHTTKMVMVPEDAYSSLISQQQQLMPPVAMQLSNLDTELKSILNNPSLTVDEKYDRYYRTFNRYNQLHGRQFNTPPPAPEPIPQKTTVVEKAKSAEKATSTTGVPVSEQALLDSLPKIARRRGKLLLEHLKRKQEIQWSDKGELLMDGHVVEGSNATDLLHYFTRDRPKTNPPEGAREFAELLQDTNVPVEAVVPESFNRAGTLTFDLGTLFSPKCTPPPKERQKKVLLEKKLSRSALGKRKITRPTRFETLKWEKL